MVIVFIILPCISYALMNRQISLTEKSLAPILKSLISEDVTENQDKNRTLIKNFSLIDNIKVLKIDGIRTSRGMLSVSPISPIRGNENKICLNLEASSMQIINDTLVININDPSRIYQGYIRLRGLQTYILNGDTIKYNK